jgi:anti-sigma B factor antagonist
VKISRSERSGKVVLEIEGAIQLGESGEQLSAALRSELEGGAEDVLLELSRINYADSTGIGELVGYFVRFGEAGKRLVLVKPSQRIRELLRVTNLDTLFEIHESLEAALAAAPEAED